MKNSESKYYNTALLMDEALLFLLEKKDYEFITIKEICEKAGVNRSTFYLHYETMEDLLVETIEMITKRFYETFDNEILDINNLHKDELFLTNGFKNIFAKELVSLVLNWFENKFIVIYRSDSLRVLREFNESESKKFYVERTLTEAAQEFGIIFV